MVLLRKVALKMLTALAACCILANSSISEPNLAEAMPASISAQLNTTACPATPPTLINGGFESFSNPATSGNVATGTYTQSGWPFSQYPFGYWHAYGGGPDMFLFLKKTSGNTLPGWSSTSDLIEIQRQVASYSISHDPNMVNSTSYSPARSGLANATTTAAGADVNLYGPQPAEGTYWAELNAFELSALYQDITVPADARLFWSLKHRGRGNTTEIMKVLVGPKSVGAAGVMGDPALVEQTSLRKFLPTNTDVYTGIPTYSSSSVSTSTIGGSIGDGWNQYMGTVAPDPNATVGTTINMRFQFQSVSAPWGGAVGNLLDDIRFTPFLACPVTRNLHVGQTVNIDVTGSDGGSNGTAISYGLGQGLDAVGNITGGASDDEFTTSGNIVSFTPDDAGTFTIDYQVTMPFGSQTYTAASRITYNVAPSPIVTYSPEGGSVLRTSDLLPLGNTLSTLSFPTPSRNGYNFIGWFTAANGGSEVTNTYASSITPSADLTLFAHWSPMTYPVVFEEQGGTQVSDGTYSTGGSITLPPAPLKPGYRFTGWFENPSGGNSLGSSYSPVGTGAVTLYAQWEAAPTANSSAGLLATTGMSIFSGWVALASITIGLFISRFRRPYISKG